MTDPTRRRIMRAVGRTNTSVEMAVRRELFARGYRYQVNVRSLPGSPDLLFARRRVAIFVNGCFWHQHQGCRLATIPKTRTEFWQNKFEDNRRRDRRNRRALEQAGWRVIDVWQCEIETGEFLNPLLLALGPTRCLARAVGKLPDGD